MENNEKKILNFLCETTAETGEKLTIISVIETGLNIVAQDILWKHTDQDIDNLIKRFRFLT